MNKQYFDQGYEVPACKRQDLLRFAATIHKTIGYNPDTPFPVMKFVEQVLYELYPDYKFEIVEISKLPNKLGETFPHTHHIKLREDVYIAAANNNPFARLTVMHEAGHCMWHDRIPISLPRRDASNIPAYSSSEWQANALAGALLMPFVKIVEMTPEEIADKYLVTISAAKNQRKAARFEWTKLEKMRESFGGGGSFGLY